MDPFPRIKRSGRDANHSPPSSVEFKNAWSYTFPLSPYSFKVGCFGTLSEEFLRRCCDIAYDRRFWIGLDKRRIVFRFQVEQEVLLKACRPFVVPTLFTLPLETGEKADNSPPSVAEVKGLKSYTSTSPCALMLCRGTNLFIIKPTRCANFTKLFWHETTFFGQFLCPSSGVYSL